MILLKSNQMSEQFNKTNTKADNTHRHPQNKHTKQTVIRPAELKLPISHMFNSVWEALVQEFFFFLFLL